jgi:hypothetical protein
MPTWALQSVSKRRRLERTAAMNHQAHRKTKKSCSSAKKYLVGGYVNLLVHVVEPVLHFGPR